MIGRFVALRHQPRQRAGDIELVADNLGGVEPDGPRINGPRQGLTVTVDNVATFRNQRGYPDLATGVIAERREEQNPRDDQGNHSAVHQHSEHQPLVHYGQDLASLPDEPQPLWPQALRAEPLGPLGDEGGRRCIHCFEPFSLTAPGARRKRPFRLGGAARGDRRERSRPPPCV